MTKRTDEKLPNGAIILWSQPRPAVHHVLISYPCCITPQVRKLDAAYDLRKKVVARCVKCSHKAMAYRKNLKPRYCRECGERLVPRGNGEPPSRVAQRHFCDEKCSALFRRGGKHIPDSERQHARAIVSLSGETIFTNEMKILRDARRDAGLCTACGLRPPPDGYKTCAECRCKRKLRYDDQYRDWQHKRGQVQKEYDTQRVLDAYGHCCACCGESEPLFLELDHINNDGYAHRRAVKAADAGGGNFYRWLIKNNFPDGFQILCSNCNHGKHRNGGVCPHKTRTS